MVARIRFFNRQDSSSTEGAAVVGRIGGINASDSELKDRIREGDGEVLADLLELYWSPLVAYLSGLLTGRDEAEDVAQEAFLRLWAHRSDWSPSGSVRLLLYRIGRNLALNERRRIRIRLRSHRKLSLAEDSRINPTPEDVLEGRELGKALEQALRSLPARRREVFELRQIHGLSVQDTADIMGLSPQTVKNQMGAAAADLRRLLRSIL
jgi:RNA polymerase sigma-70 factor (ECF subfamily)